MSTVHIIEKSTENTLPLSPVIAIVNKYSHANVRSSEKRENFRQKKTYAAEEALSESELRLASSRNEVVQIKETYEHELRKREMDFMGAREQLQLREEHWKVEIEQRDSERQRRDIEVQQWTLGRQQSEIERQEWEVGRRQWESKAERYDADLRDIKSRWKQTAKELNGLRAQGQGFYQVTDNYLYDLITQLRYKVRDFGIQYFSEKLPKRSQFEPNRVWKENMVPTTRDESYLDLVNCSETRPSVIQAFMWRVIVQEVFCKFRWAGTASSPVTQLCKDLEPCLNGGSLSPADIEATKRFHTWRATTVGLLLDSMDEQKRRQADVELQKWMSEVHDEAHVNLRLLGPNDQKGCQQGFLDIIDEAVKIDKEISRQVSRVTWTFGSEDVIQTLDLASMELRKGEVFKPKSKVTLVTSPGVIKQGKSTGEGFESSFDLLKMEVSCETAASWQ
ncbi:uncharacterized protein J4E88_001770 [Alternaria novae-zelandiae]|uniref:uncharacterized protein n=1 Tax=Alternaria novae-zelandiae TaxID=430562 RepID=UPI0020C3CB3D|nr:uncharacterized protein J4E88_001770 [Alternaria novae-zelandiae]KAI4693399.1 hypothetical protein J4E88_001770 [Alternaria novae-zelandiae]